VLQRLPRVLPSLAGAPVDTFLLALFTVVALLFLLYGVRLSPT
jgi:hypothetical protein